MQGEINDVLSITDGSKFEVHCDAGTAGELHVGTESLLVKIGQRVRMDGSEEMWHSVVINCDADKDGSLRVKVIICHFDWKESRQIALIESKPNHNQETGTLTFDLEQRGV